MLIIKKEGVYEVLTEEEEVLSSTGAIQMYNSQEAKFEDADETALSMLGVV